MTLDTGLIEEMHEQLSRDREALLAGKLNDVIRRQGSMDDLTQRFADMLAKAEASQVSEADRKQVLAIERLSRENAVLFEAAIKTVNRLIVAIHAQGAVSSVGAYDAAGRPKVFQRAVGTFAENA